MKLLPLLLTLVSSLAHAGFLEDQDGMGALLIIIPIALYVWLAPSEREKRRLRDERCGRPPSKP